MKNQFFKITLTSVIVLGSLVAFSQENRQAANARKNLKEAKIDSADDFNRFKKNAEDSIKENEKEIRDLKSKKSEANKEIREKYNKKVAALEDKNKKLKNKIEGCSNTKTDMWTSFKNDFNHDMEALGHAIRDMA